MATFPTVTDYIRPKDPVNDKYGTHHENFSIGGARNVMTIAAMHNIPVEKRRRQMIVSVYSDSGSPALYWLLSPDNTTNNLSNNTYWTKIPLGTSFPSGITFKGQFSAVSGQNENGTAIQDSPLSPIDSANGWFYICNAAGTFNFGSGNQTFNLGDWLIYDGSSWRKLAQVSALQWNLITGIPNIILNIASGTLQIATQEDFQTLQEQINSLVIPVVVSSISGADPDAVATVQAIIDYVYSRDEVDQSLTDLLNTINNTLSNDYYDRTAIDQMITDLEAQVNLASQGIQGEFDTISERDLANNITTDEQWAVLQDGNVYRFTGSLGDSGSEYWEYVRKYIISNNDPTLGGETPSEVVPPSEAAVKAYIDENAGGSGNSIGLGPRTFETETTSPPAANCARLNNATHESATKLFLSNTDTDGADRSSAINELESNSLIRLIKDQDNFLVFKCSGKTAETGYFDIDLAYLEKKGDIQDNDEVSVGIDLRVDLSGKADNDQPQAYNSEILFDNNYGSFNTNAHTQAAQIDFSINWTGAKFGKTTYRTIIGNGDDITFPVGAESIITQGATGTLTGFIFTTTNAQRYVVAIQCTDVSNEKYIAVIIDAAAASQTQLITPTLAAVVGDNTVQLTASSVDAAATLIHWERSPSGAGTYTELAANLTNPYDDNTAVNGTTYDYRCYLTAPGYAQSEYSNIETVTPASIPSLPQITGLVASNPGVSSIDLSWNATSGNESAIEIYQSTASGSGFSLVKTIDVGGTSTTIFNLSDSTQYYFQVREKGDGVNYNNGPFSTEATSTTLSSTGAATIISATMAFDNAYITIVFDRGIWGDPGNTIPVDINDFVENYTQSTGEATSVNVLGVKRDDTPYFSTSSNLTGGESVIRIWLEGNKPFTGVESLEYVVATNSIYNSDAQVTSNTQTTGAKTLNSQYQNYVNSGVSLEGLLDYMVEDDTQKFSVECIIRNYTNLTNKRIFGKDSASENLRGFVMFISPDNQLRTLYRTEDNSSSRGVQSGSTIPAPSGSTSLKLKFEYDPTIDTNNGLDRCKFWINDVETTGKSLYDNVGSFPFDLGQNNVPVGLFQIFNTSNTPDTVNGLNSDVSQVKIYQNDVLKHWWPRPQATVGDRINGVKL